MKYRKRETFEAVQYLGNGKFNENPGWVRDLWENKQLYFVRENAWYDGKRIEYDVLHYRYGGNYGQHMELYPGSWLIRYRNVYYNSNEETSYSDGYLVYNSALFEKEYEKIIGE